VNLFIVGFWMSKRLQIAIFVEDNTDYETVREIVHSVLGTNIKTKKWDSEGCSTLRQKLTAKLKLFSNQGWDNFIIVHDLDLDPKNNCHNDEPNLRKSLEESCKKVGGINSHICIPIEEIEAWFWADPKVIDHVGKGNGTAHSNPHLIRKPKEKLKKISLSANSKPRYSTNDNAELMRLLDFDLCSDRCPSFKELVAFLNEIK
jgi:Domain of unknown function (DUF4276)